MKGYIALISVLIISAIVVLVVAGANLLSISESKMGLQENQALEAFYLANLCSEDALMKFKNNSNYKGDENLIFENGSCRILPIEKLAKKDRLIKVTGTAYNQTRKIKIEVRPTMEIKSWQQVADF